MDSIESKINEIAKLVFELEEADLSSFTAIVTELKMLEAIVAALPDGDSRKNYVSVITKTIDFLVNQINASTDYTLALKNLSESVSNIQEIFVNKKDPSGLKFPFRVEINQEEETSSSAIHLDEDLVAEFVEKLHSDLTDLESMLLKLESSESFNDDLIAIKRLVHTIKGEAGVLNLMDIQLVCHEAETYIENHATIEIVDKLLDVKDWLTSKSQELTGEIEAEEHEKPESLIERLFQETQEVVSDQNPAKDVQESQEETPDESQTIQASAVENNENLQEEANQEKEIQKESNEQLTQPENVEKITTPVQEEVKEQVIMSENQDYSYIADESATVSLDDEEFIREFLTEAAEHLDNVDQAVLTLEQDPEDKDAINVIFRAYHTIKGISGMLDFEDVKNVAHNAENILDMARQDELQVNGDVIDIIFESTDKLRNYLDEIETAINGEKVFYRDKNAPAMIEMLKGFIERVKGGESSTQQAEASKAQEKPQEHNVIQETVAEKKEESVPQKVVEQAEKKEQVPVAAAEKVAANVSSAKTVEKKPSPTKSAKDSKKVTKVKELIKVDTAVLDKILNTIGEIVIAQSMVQRNFSEGEVETDKAERNLRQLEKITRELQELGMSLRMTSVKSTFEKMARLVRDVAKKTGKLVTFQMEGEDTELDRNVVERISDPLVHMIRNAVDHGIEDNAEDRISAGKKPSGNVILRAFYEGGNVHIQIQDDGKGLDRDVIFRKAVEKGIVTEGQKMSDEEVFSLIFAPGFSTAAQITDVSGRGVGMDVVKKNIEALRGRIGIKSQKGEGTIFTIMLPLTLAIIDGMIIKVGEEKFIIPTLNISESIKVRNEQFNYALGKGESVMIRNELIPVYRLNDMFGIKKMNHKNIGNDSQLMVVVENVGKQVGLLVDEIVGQQQIVIKNLGSLFKDLKGFSGGAIMADGSVGLIIDIASLVSLDTQLNRGQISEAMNGMAMQ